MNKAEKLAFQDYKEKLSRFNQLNQKIWSADGRLQKLKLQRIEAEKELEAARDELDAVINGE